MTRHPVYLRIDMSTSPGEERRHGMYYDDRECAEYHRDSLTHLSRLQTDDMQQEAIEVGKFLIFCIVA